MANSEKVNTKEEVERLLQLAGRPDQPQLSKKRDVKAKLKEQWRASVKAQKARRLRKRVLPIALAATIMLTLLAAQQWLLAPPVPTPLASVTHHSGDYLVESNYERGQGNLYLGDLLVTTRDAAVAITLNDGTTLQLDGSSHVTFTDERELWLHAGRIYVDSPGDRTSIVIKTTWGTLTDIGTRFEVQIEDETLKLAMREGVVKVYLLGTDQPIQAKVDSFVGDVIVINQDLDVTNSSIHTTSPGWDWTLRSTPAFPAGAHSLTSVLTWAARITGRELKYDRAIMELQAQNEIVHWPEIEAVDVEKTLSELSVTTSKYEVTFTDTNLGISRRE